MRIEEDLREFIFENYYKGLGFMKEIAIFCWKNNEKKI